MRSTKNILDCLKESKIDWCKAPQPWFVSSQTRTRIYFQPPIMKNMFGCKVSEMAIKEFVFLITLEKNFISNIFFVKTQILA